MKTPSDDAGELEFLARLLGISICIIAVGFVAVIAAAAFQPNH